MISDKLQKARIFEKEKGAGISPQNRPLYHLTPQAGWMNDPNGFSFFNGMFHLFYQYYPYTTEWGPMHWGHAVSKDLLTWEYLPAALAPDQPYDAEGCWSGSAVEISGEPSRHLLIYTGREPFMNNGKEEIRQVQCIAVGDGLDYEKYDGNPVISSEDLPEGASIYDFRDPKIWRDDIDECFYMVAGSRAEDGHGQVLLYQSRDAFSWNYIGILDASHGQLGSMWECPDFFELDGESFLILSPQNMKQEGEFQNINGNVYIRGIYDREKHTFIRKEVHALDFGHDFYAAQTMQTPDGRRIVIAWMQGWENAASQKHPYGWAGMMTIPRELTVKDGCLLQNPIRELESRRTNKVMHESIPVGGRIRLNGIRGRCIDMTLRVSPARGSDYKSFEVHFAEGEIRGQYYAVILKVDRKEGLVTLDRSVSGYCDDSMTDRRINIKDDRGESMSDITFRILLDRFSAEIFINNGRYVMSSRISTGQEADGISFMADGNAVITVEKYDIV